MENQVQIGTIRHRPRLYPPVALAFGVYVIALAALFTAGVYVQVTLGTLGLIITELMILAFPLVATAVFRLDFVHTFRLHKTKLRYYFGGILLWMGVYGLEIGLINLLNLIDPTLSETNEALTDTFSGMGFFGAAAVVAVMPAICEEFFFRGFFQTSLESRMRPVWPILLSGVMFGIYHFDPSRMVITALLGCAIAYTAYRARSIFPAMVIHFLNNMLSVCSAFLLEWMNSLPAVPAEQAAAAEAGWIYVVVVLMYTVAGLGLAISGVVVLRK